MVSSQPQQTHIYHSMSEAVNEAEQPAQPPVAEQSSNKQLVVEGQTVTLVTAGVGRGIQTSSIWKYLVEFEPPVGAGNRKRNVKCMVKRTLPASGLMQERQVVCGHLMRYLRKDKNTSGTGTTGLWSHFEKHHKEIYDAEMKVSPSSTQGQKRKALLISGESGVMDFFFCFFFSIPAFLYYLYEVLGSTGVLGVLFFIFVNVWLRVFFLFLSVGAFSHQPFFQLLLFSGRRCFFFEVLFPDAFQAFV